MKKTIMMPALALAMMLNAVTAGHVWAQSALTDGQVTKVDASAGKITIKHGPMKKFDMEDGMTMVYRVQDPAMLTAVKAGDKIKFDADHVNGQFIVTKIQTAK
jgi:Cu(I)/Ag(I) efflux system periplasmic protein CusF